MAKNAEKVREFCQSEKVGTLVISQSVSLLFLLVWKVYVYLQEVS